jgi:RNA polymerase sigma factor (sigma-70 family)
MANAQVSTLVQHIRNLVGPHHTVHLTDGQLLGEFRAHRDEAAFAALVQRHGSMVLRVCRRVLRHRQDAEDAFQATFLALARNAASIRKRESLASWLHGVAYRMASNAKRAAARRRAHESRAEAPPHKGPGPDLAWREVQAVLDEEIERLPEKYRAVFVPCCLEGQSRADVARQLGLKEGTLSSRLAEARGRLRQRLARRGISLSAVLGAAALARGACTADVPARLFGTTVRAALPYAAGARAVAGTVSANVAALVEGGSRVMVKTTLKIATALVLTLGALALAAGRPPVPAEPQNERSAQGRPQAPSAPRAAKPGPETRDQGTITVAGRVLDADGKPVAGAEVAVVARGWDFAAKEYQVLKKGSADRDGRFRLTAPRHSSGEGYILAGKPGYGLSQQILNPQAERQETVFKLPPEQPLRGRLLDLQGQPAAGVQVAVTRIGARDDVSLSAPPEGLPLWPKPATSDSEGRLTIAGLPRNHEVVLLVQGDRFAWQPLRLPPNNGAGEMTWTLSPARLLEGKVVHADTGKPAANARLVIAPAGITGRTDKSGRFKLSLPAVEQRDLPPLLVYPAEGEPYLPVRQQIVWPRGAVKHATLVKLPRGVLVRGRVTESPSGRPVAGAGVQSVPREAGNPNLRRDVLTGWEHLAVSGSDGSFRLAVLPGPGHLLISGPGLDFIHEEVGSRVLAEGKPGGYRIYADGLVKLDLAADSGPQDVTVTLRRGVTIRGRLLGPGGKPVARAQMVCRLLHTAVPSLFHVEVQGGLFALHGCDPGKDYPVYFLDAEDGWGATVTLSGKQAGGGPVTVRLAPCGRGVARFVDPEGRPLKNHLIRSAVILKMVVTPGPPCEQADGKGLLEADQVFAENLLRPKDRVARKQLKTDAEGRITYSRLVPGATYRLSVWEKGVGVVLKKEVRAQGEKTLDVGDVQLQGGAE